MWSRVEPDGIAYSDPVVWRSVDGVDWFEVGVATGLPTLDTPRAIVSGQQPGERYQLPPREGTIDDMALMMWQFDNGTRITHLRVSNGERWGASADHFYTSEDGFTWTAAPSIHPMYLTGSAMADGWLVAAWEDWSPPNSLLGEYGAVTTNDGETWFRLTGPDGWDLDSYHPDNAGAVGAQTIVTYSADASDDGQLLPSTSKGDPNETYRAFPPG